MTIRKIVFSLLFLFTSTQLFAQVKIGYTNIELILAYMPETQSLENELSVYQRKKAEEIKTSEDMANVKLEEYQSLKKANRLSPEEDQRRQKELMDFDAELRKKAEAAQFALETKRQELLQPIMEKLQTTIDAVSKEKGYTYILNQTTSAGVSTILYGPQEDDITEEVMKRLGIKVPEE